MLEAVAGHDAVVKTVVPAIETPTEGETEAVGLMEKLPTITKLRNVS